MLTRITVRVSADTAGMTAELSDAFKKITVEVEGVQKASEKAASGTKAAFDSISTAVVAAGTFIGNALSSIASKITSFAKSAFVEAIELSGKFQNSIVALTGQARA